MMAKLTKAAEARNHPDWAHGPEDAGETAFPHIACKTYKFISLRWVDGSPLSAPLILL